MNPTQQEQLLNIGAYLRDIRQEEGKQIDEVANQIFIRPALVRAIENGDWESLPEPVFVQGFIRRYADSLGLNGRELSEKFEPTPVSVLPNPELATRGAVDGIVKPEDKHGLKVLSKAAATPKGPTVVQATPSPKRQTWVIGGLILAALIGVIAWLTTRNTPQITTPSSTPDETTAASTEPETGTASGTDDPAPTDLIAGDGPDAASETTASSDAPITFAVSIEDDAWLRVTADGERVYEGTLAAGSEEAWTADNELRITAGNSGSVLYSFNGSEEQPMGAPGSVANLTLTPDSDVSSNQAE